MSAYATVVEAAPGDLGALVARADVLGRARRRTADIANAGEAWDTGKPVDSKDTKNTRDPVDRPALLGIVGPPGVGKSWLTVALGRELRARGITVATVPMDGFHLSRRAAEELGRMSRRGAPDTFDGDGYVALLRRLRDVRRVGRAVWVPSFERDLEDPIAGDLPVGPEVDIVLTEGNYLLLDEEPWDAVAGLLDEAWYLRADDEAARLRRLVARHVAAGKEPAHARAHAEGSDEANARLIATTAERADVLVAWRTVEGAQGA